MSNIEIFKLSNHNELIVIFHQSERIKKNEYILFGGYCEIAVLHGRIMIQGFTIDNTNSSVDVPFLVSSFRKTKEQIAITNITSNTEVGDSMNRNVLLQLFPNDEKCIDKACKSIKKNSAVLYFHKNETPLLLQLKAMYPKYLRLPVNSVEEKLFLDAAILKKQRFVRDNYYLSSGVQLKVKEITEKLSSDKKDNIVRILTCGSSENCISALNKYIVNNCLNIKKCKIYWAELNVEEPEFTPPGVVSLTHITEPILVDSYLHFNSDVVYGLFYGKNYVEGEDQKYITMVSSIIYQFVQVTQKDPSFSYLLVVNTMAMRGMYKRDFISTIVNITTPDDVFLCCQGKPSRYMPMNWDINRTIILEAPMNATDDGELHDDNPFNYENDKSMLKRILFSGYFSQFISAIEKSIFTLNLLQWPCYQVAFSRVKLHVQDKFITFENDTFDDALNIVLVALCTMSNVNDGGFYMHDLNQNKTLQLLNPRYKGVYKRINHRKTNLLFIGYGIITNIDQSTETIDICTPISREKLLEVNVLVKPSCFNIPSEILRLQNDCEYSYSRSINNDNTWSAWNKDLSRFIDINDKSDYRSYNDIEYKRIRQS